MQKNKGLLIGAAMACLAAGAHAENPPNDMKLGMELMKQQMMLMTPELAQKANALSPDIKKFLMRVALRHERRSDTLTLVQVMQEIMAEHQMIGAAIATDNGPMAADAARRLAMHRLPKGGMLPYLPIDKVTTESLSVLPSMEAAVEGNAQKLATAAEKGNMVEAAHLYGEITVGCVACHNHFRGQPGASAYVPRLK